MGRHVGVLGLASLGPATSVCDLSMYVFNALSVSTTRLAAAALADGDDAGAARRRLDRARARRFVRERFGDVLRGTPYVLDVTTGGRGNVAIGELICAVAEAVDADAVCMSTRDRGPVARFFVGSVANYCLRNATMPVVMVRPGERAKTRRSRVVFDDER